MPGLLCQAASVSRPRCSTKRPSSLLRPNCSASGTNRSGNTMPSVGWFQRISASAPCHDARMVDLRLEVEVELAVGEPRPEVADQLVALGLAVHRQGIEQRDAVAARGLGLVHRDVGALQQLVGPLFAAVEDHHADARRSDVAQRAELESGRSAWPASGWPRGWRVASRGRGRPSASSRMTTNSSPPMRATVSRCGHASPQPLGDLHEEGVADVVALRVVERLEVVEVDEQQRAVVAVLASSRRSPAPCGSAAGGGSAAR